MKKLIQFSILTATLLITGLSATEKRQYQVQIKPLPVHACYAPGTEWQYIEDTARQSVNHFISTSLAALPLNGNGTIEFLFTDNNRWDNTATDGAGLQQGDPTTLTWSIVPDGVMIPGYNGEPASNNILESELNKIYGSKANWLPVFEQVFQRWGELTGITYIYEPNDDGAALPNNFPSTPGQLGVRGDIRISGHPIDGNFGILAYNFFPNSGEMVIDVPDSFYNNTSNNSRRLRNTLAHENGHGIGLNHSCPSDQTKLMEPLISTSYDGPQPDDILDANRGYGDPNEHNDQAIDAIPFGTNTQISVANLSVDDETDVDYFSLQLGDSSDLSVTLAPSGSTYNKGAQTQNSCTGTPFDSLSLQDLQLELLDTDGVSVLLAVDNTQAGFAEQISNFLVNQGAGTYYLRVAGNTLDLAQLYSLDVTVVPLDPCGGSIVDLSNLVVNPSEIFNCSASQKIIMQNVDVFATGSLNLTAPIVEMRTDVTIQDGGILNINN